MFLTIVIGMAIFSLLWCMLYSRVKKVEKEYNEALECMYKLFYLTKIMSNQLCEILNEEAKG